jgi:isoleucyl-tRNA synthetase
MYRAVPAQIDLPGMEHGVLALWDTERVFEQSVEQAADRPLWVF